MMKAIIASKRGRPKRSAANDNTDLGTQELQLKRATLAQGVDLAHAGHPLDLLMAHGLIVPQAHRAGWRYAGLYRRVIGRTDISYGRLYDGLSGDGGRAGVDAADDADLRATQRNFRLAQAALRAEGPVVAGITERVAVFGAWPDWLLQSSGPAHRDLNLLRQGLARLTAAATATDRVLAQVSA